MKRSLIRLIVDLLGFVAAIFELAIRLVQLATLAVDRLAMRLQGQTPAAVASTAVAPTNDMEERLISALTGPSLGFPVRSARAFAATVRVRLTKEPIEVLVKEGIASLSN